MYTNINETPLKSYPRPFKSGVGGYQYADWHADGWREIEEPELSENEKFGAVIYDEETDTAIYGVVEKTDIEIYREAQRKQEAILRDLMIRKLQNDLQDDEDDEALNNMEAYPYFKDLIGSTIPVDFKLQAFNSEGKMSLFKSLAEHEVDANFPPAITDYRYVEIQLHTEIPVWEKPQGYENTYEKGALVWFPEKDTMVFENLIDNNGWSPDESPTTWQERPDLI